MKHTSKSAGKSGRRPQDPSGLERLRRKRFRRYLRRNLRKLRSTLTTSLPKKTDRPPHSPLLDGLYPKRRNEWIAKVIRASDISVDLSRLSFVDFPGRAMTMLRSLIKADCMGKRITINYLDVDCLDVGPYLVMAIMEQSLGAPENVIGGTISSRMQQVLEASEIAQKLKMRAETAEDSKNYVWPIRVQSCRHTPSDAREGFSSRHARLSDEFTASVETWLNQLGFGLNEKGSELLMRMVAEVLENGVIHSQLGSQDGEAWFAGFMSRAITESGRPSETYMCHLSIVSIGATIYESMQTCSAAIRQQIETLVRKHTSLFRVRQHWTPEALWTLYAFQDGVSRMSGGDAPRSGFGLMDLVQFFGELSGKDAWTEQGKLVVISGNTCIRMNGRRPTKGNNGLRRMALNEQDDLERPPDSAYIKKLKHKFPGTLFSLRFPLSRSYLQRLTANAAASPEQGNEHRPENDHN